MNYHQPATDSVYTMVPEIFRIKRTDMAIYIYIDSARDPAQD